MLDKNSPLIRSWPIRRAFKPTNYQEGKYCKTKGKGIQAEQSLGQPKDF